MKIADHFLAKIDDPDFNILNFRQELEKNNFDEEEIKVVVRLVDNALQRRQSEKTVNSKLKEFVWIGGAITVVGLVVTIGTFAGLIETENYYLVAYGPILGGLGILFYGLAKRR